MAWNLDEALAHYGSQGAPGDQIALVSLLKEVQAEHHGGIPQWVLPQIALAYGVKENYLTAVIRRFPSLRLEDTHCLELCGGPNCSKRKALASFVERTYGTNPATFTLKFTGCMRMCGKGPNIKWDGQIYHQADEDLIRRLVEGI